MTPRNDPQNPDPELAGHAKSPTIVTGNSGAATAMRIIVPLQGVVQGRGGIVLGSLIPCALFYFLQIYLRRNRGASPPSTPSPSPEVSSSGLLRTLSWTLLSSTESTGGGPPATVSARALSLIRSCNSPYDIGQMKASEDPYNELLNPEGIVHLGFSENRVSLDLVENWLKENARDSIIGKGLSINGIATYQPHDGCMELKMAVADFMSRSMDGSVSLNPSRLILTAGIASAIENICFCLADPGNVFLLPSPYLPCFDNDIKWRTGIEIIPVPCRSSDGFNLSIATLDRSFNQAKNRGQKICGLVISNPSNPTGSLLNRKSLQDLLDFAKTKNIHIISNEVYAHGIQEFASMSQIIRPDDFDRVHIVFDLSQDLSFPGLNLGAIYSFNENVISALKKMGRFSSISAPTQRLMASMLLDTKFMQRFIATHHARVERLYNEFVGGLKVLGIECIKRYSGLYCWADMSRLIPSYGEKGEMELWGKMLNVAKVNAIPGSCCHCIEPGWFGFCVSSLSEKDVPIVMDRMRKVCG